MGKRPPSAENDERVERLRILLSFFETERHVNRTRLAEEFLGYDKSTLSNAVTRQQVSAELRMRFEERLGVQHRYWNSERRLTPAECMPAAGEHVSPSLRAKAFSVQRLTQIAKRRGDPPSVAGRLAYLEPPVGQEGDAWWWIEEYFKIVDDERSARLTTKKGG